VLPYHHPLHHSHGGKNGKDINGTLEYREFWRINLAKFGVFLDMDTFQCSSYLKIGKERVIASHQANLTWALWGGSPRAIIGKLNNLVFVFFLLLLFSFYYQYSKYKRINMFRVGLRLQNHMHKLLNTKLSGFAHIVSDSAVGQQIYTYSC
jgi:hypothetical protein